jgi:hypothetical protein
MDQAGVELENKVDEIKLANELAEHFRQQYRQAAEIARVARR